jgi:D-alanyl-D-alanine carboxypeptidase
MKNKWLCLVFSYTFLWFGYAQNNPQIVQNDSIKTLIQETINKYNLPGLSFSLISKDGEIENYSFGFSDVEDKIPLEDTHTFFSGSIGKTYAATLIFQLIDQKKIGLHHTFISYFPDTEWLKQLPNIDQITIEMLLQHSSGLPRYVMKPEIWQTLYNDPDKVWSYKDRLSVIFNDLPLHEAGKSWAYSDTN